MAFKDTYRLEKVYYENMWTLLRTLKALKENHSADEITKVNEILDDAIACNESIIIIYKNLGELYAEVSQKYSDLLADMEAIRNDLEMWKNEINEKIDEVNNYLMALIRDLEQRMEAVEADLATMNRNKYYDLVENNGSYLIEKDGETVYFDDIKEDVDFPHNVILRYDSGTDTVELEVREFTDSRIDFYLIGLADSDKTVKEILVSIDDTEAVTYSENTLENPLYTFGTGLSLDSNNELSVDFSTVQAKLTEGTGIDIDSNNEISVDTSVIQEKLSEGFGIDIDSNNEIKVDTAQVQEKLIAGQNITLTPDSTDPTKTVIDASGGSSYTAGAGIDITNDVISQKKLKHGTQTSLGTQSSVTLYYNAYDYMNEATNNTLFTLPANIVNDIVDNLKGLYVNCLISGGSSTTRPIIDSVEKSAEIRAGGSELIFYQNNVAKLKVALEGLYAYYGETGSSIINPLYNKYIYDIWKYLDKDVSCVCKLVFQGYPFIEAKKYAKATMQTYWTGLNGTYKFGGSNSGYGTLT